jgi:hypothetical protein
MVRLLVGTDAGLHELEVGGALARVELDGRRVTALAPDYPAIWAIVDDHEVWRSDDGRDWAMSAVLEGRRATCVAAPAMGTLVGSSEAHLYRAGAHDLVPELPFDRVEDRGTWYTPWGGPPDARSISEGDAVYVNVHVGGIVRTVDGGETWTPTIDIDADVHRVWADDRRVLAACARGLAVSDDLGESWSYRTDGLEATYCRGVTVCGDSVLVSSSRGPRGGQAAVYRGGAGGGALERCRSGLPERFDDNIDSSCLDALPDGRMVAFGTSDGRVFASDDQGARWAEVTNGLGPVRCLLAMP